MEITRALTELLFTMHLQRELDLQRRLGQTPDMKHAVYVAKEETRLTVETIRAEGL